MLDNPLIEGATEPVDAQEARPAASAQAEPASAFPEPPGSPTPGLSAWGLGASDWDDVFPAQPARPTASPAEPDTFKPAASPNESFDPYSLAEAASETELSELREQLFRYKLRELAPGIENDEALVIAATKTLERAGTPLTPEAVAAEYRRLDAEQAAKYEARASRRSRPSGGTYTGPAGYSGVRRAKPSAPADAPKTLIEVIKADRRRRGLSFY